MQIIAPTLSVRYNVHMQKIVTATEARKKFFDLVRLASKEGSSVIITLEGCPPVRMMSQDEWEGWMETLEIMSDPELMKQIQEGINDPETVPWEEVKKDMGIS